MSYVRRITGFAQLIRSWEKTEAGQIMVERVDSQMIENYGIADIDGKESLPF